MVANDTFAIINCNIAGQEDVKGTSPEPDPSTGYRYGDYPFALKISMQQISASLETEYRLIYGNNPSND